MDGPATKNRTQMDDGTTDGGTAAESSSYRVNILTHGACGVNVSACMDGLAV